MRLYVSGPHPGRRYHRTHGGSLLLALILLGAAFGLSPVLGWLLLVLAAVSAVTYIVVQVWAAVRHGKPSKPAAGSGDAGWRADHVPASAEYKAAHPAGPRDWEPVS